MLRNIKLAYPQAKFAVHLAAGQHAWGGRPSYQDITPMDRAT
jgi:hypothetical protein